MAVIAFSNYRFVQDHLCIQLDEEDESKTTSIREIMWKLEMVCQMVWFSCAQFWYCVTWQIGLIQLISLKLSMTCREACLSATVLSGQACATCRLSTNESVLSLGILLHYTYYLTRITHESLFLWCFQGCVKPNNISLCQVFNRMLVQELPRLLDVSKEPWAGVTSHYTHSIAFELKWSWIYSNLLHVVG